MTTPVPPPRWRWKYDVDPLGSLMGSGKGVYCRVVNDDISMHWWRNDDSGLCLCGKTRKNDSEEEAP